MQSVAIFLSLVLLADAGRRLGAIGKRARVTRQRVLREYFMLACESLPVEPCRRAGSLPTNRASGGDTQSSFRIHH